jgi:hypothetical protein
LGGFSFHSQLAGDAAVLLHRVSDLDETLRRRGLRLEHRIELALGPSATFRSPGGQRLALHELTRPEMASTLSAAQTSDETEPISGSSAYALRKSHTWVAGRTHYKPFSASPT